MTRAGNIFVLIITAAIAGLAWGIGTGAWIDGSTTYASHTMSGDQWTVRGAAGQPAVDTLTGDDWTILGGSIGPLEDTCLGDLDGSGIVDITDLLDFLSVYGTADADLNGDGLGDVNDLLVLLAAFGGCG